LWLRSSNRKNKNSLINKNEFQNNAFFENTEILNEISGSILKKYWCDDMKLVLKKKKLCWKTLNYTVPIDYDK
jgi:hypothetical protein